MRAIFIIVSIALLSTAAFAAIMEQYKTPFEFIQRQGVERVSNFDPRVNIERMEATVYLEPAQADKFKGVGRGGYAPFYARATARVKSSVYYGFPRAQVNIKTKDLDNYAFYEAWLVDTDTGYRLSLGTFSTLFGGVGELHYNVDNYLDPYDLIEITLEPWNDDTPLPGDPVLVGLIPTATEYDPAVKPSKMMGGAVYYLS